MAANILIQHHTQTHTQTHYKVTPQSKHWNLGFKTASGTYDRLRSGVGNILTDRRIAHYARLGLYGTNAQRCQAELDAKSHRKTSREKLAAMIDDLAS